MNCELIVHFDVAINHEFAIFEIESIRNQFINFFENAIDLAL